MDCGGCNGCEIEFSPRFRRCLMQNASALKSFLTASCGYFTIYRRGHPCNAIPALRAWQSAPDPKICISYGAAVTVAGSSTISTACGAVRINRPGRCLHPWLPANACRYAIGFAMALGLLEQKIHARGPGDRMNNRRRSCMAIWCSRCV